MPTLPTHVMPTVPTVAIISVCFALWQVVRWFLVKRRLDNIPGPSSPSFLTGHLTLLFGTTQRAWDFHQENLEKYGMVVRTKAFLGENTLQIADPKALHHIIIKDQHIFEEAASFTEGNMLIFGPGLLSTLGDHHKKQRKMLNPVFSTAHMREMVPVFYEITHKLRNTLEKKVQEGPQEIELLSWMTRTALELVCQSGFGYSIDDLSENYAPHHYATYAKKLAPALGEMTTAQILIAPWIRKMGPPRMLRFLLDLTPWPAVQELKEVIDVLQNTSVDIFESKKRALEKGDEAIQQQLGRGKDILSILMKANMSASAEDALPEAEVLAQMNTLTFAAMDTTSSALSRILWLMATNKDVQDKLREEIRAARKEHGDLDFDKLMALPYLEAVCRETLRYYAPVSSVFRVARQDAVIPLSKPIRGVDGKQMHELQIPRGTRISVNILGTNRSKDIWGPDAYEWKPERWLQPLPHSVTDAHVPGVYSNMMTFIGGGRACIGFKFSQLEMKVVLSLLIERFEISLPKDEEIFWQMGIVASPTVADDLPLRSQLPLVVEIAK